MPSQSAREVWFDQYTQLHAVLRPWVISGDDWEGVSPDAPAHLLEQYSGMQSVGYANGWL